MNPSTPGCIPLRNLPWLAKVNLCALVAVVVALSVVLWPAWLHDPDLSHGIFVPVLFCLLVYEARRLPQPRFLLPSKARILLSLALSALAVSLLAIAGVYAAVLDWSHSLVGFLLALSVSTVLVAAWIGFCDDRVRTIPFNWPAAVAILIWPLAAPLPPGTYARLSALLQSGVVTSVMHALHLFGIAAYRQGNVIELARGTVGVSEACSGVRSLISSVAAGLFFSGILLTRVRSRIILIVLAPVIALAMNFLRSLILTYVTSRGIPIEGAWHDVTGVGIIIGTSVLLAGLALWLEGKPQPFADVPPAKRVVTYLPTNHRLLVAVILLGVALAAYFVANTRNTQDPNAPIPSLAHLLPVTPAGWRTIPDPDMKPFVDVLRTDIIASRSYFLPQAAGPALQITVYLAYWRPGQAPVSLVASHTPDACWPGTGWVQTALPRTHEPLPVDGRMLAEAECRRFVNHDYPQYVWFWHLFGHRPLTYEDPYSFRRLLGLAFRYGFQHNQDQLFVRVSSNRPWPEIESQPIVQNLFENLRPLGL